MSSMKGSAGRTEGQRSQNGQLNQDSTDIVLLIVVLIIIHFRIEFFIDFTGLA